MIQALGALPGHRAVKIDRRVHGILGKLSTPGTDANPLQLLSLARIAAPRNPRLGADAHNGPGNNIDDDIVESHLTLTSQEDVELFGGGMLVPVSALFSGNEGVHRHADVLHVHLVIDYSASFAKRENIKTTDVAAPGVRSTNIENFVSSHRPSVGTDPPKSNATHHPMRSIIDA